MKPEGGGELWDRVRQRIMFTIHDERGELVGFGGRVIDDRQQPKYLNSPQTALYDKGRTLFNLHRARKAIAEARHAVLMEGYFDAISAWQTGVHNVVTTSGTALTEHQVLEGLDLAEADDRRRGAEAVIPVLIKIPEASVLEIYAQQAAALLRIEPAGLLKDVQAVRSGTVPVRRVPVVSGLAQDRPGKPPAIAKDEGYLLGLVMGRPELIDQLAPELATIEFVSPIYTELFGRLG